MRERRKKYFIQKEFQFKFILKFCTLFIISCVLFGAIIWVFATKTVTTSFENSRLVIKSTADYILPLLLMGTVITGLIMGLCTVILVLLISHKIAGPLYRFEKFCQMIGEGNLREVVFLRKMDQIKGLASAFNEMVGNLNNRIKEIKKHTDALNKLLEKENTSKAVHEERARLIHALDNFQLKN